MFKKPIQFIKKARKEAVTGFFMMLASLTCSAAPGGAGGAFDSAANEIAGYSSDVKKLIYAIAGVVVLVGCFNVYHKMINGDQDVKKTIMLTIGGCIALVALANALPMFFGTATPA